MQFLKIARFSKFGAYLADESGAEVLLPNRYLANIENDKTPQIGSLVWVFVYTDSDDRLVAITDMPKGTLGEILPLQVAQIAQNGVYLNLGIPKDLFMPSKNPSRFEVGQSVVVKITLDRQGRLIARQNLSDFLQKAPQNLRLKNAKILPFMRTEIGYNCVVEGKYFGIIHNNDINRSINLGVEIGGVVRKIRSDGKLDLGLLSNITDVKTRILAMLHENNGILELHFGSTSQDIESALGISKKAFKTAINALVKEKKIIFNKDSSQFLLAQSSKNKNSSPRKSPKTPRKQES